MDNAKLSKQMSELQGADPDAVVKALTPMESAVKKLNDSMRAERESRLRAIMTSFITDHSLEEASQILAAFKCDRLAQCLKLSPVDFSLLVGKLLGREEPEVSISTPYSLLAEFRMCWANHRGWSVVLGKCGNPECVFCGAKGDFLIRVDAALDQEAFNAQ